MSRTAVATCGRNSARGGASSGTGSSNGTGGASTGSRRIAANSAGTAPSCPSVTGSSVLRAVRKRRSNA